MENQIIYNVQLILINKFGEYKGLQHVINQENYDELIKMSKTFYSKGGFELTCEDGSYMIFPPEIVKNSILIIKNIINNVQE